jgi:hypothetical protein
MTEQGRTVAFDMERISPVGWARADAAAFRFRFPERILRPVVPVLAVLCLEGGLFAAFLTQYLDTLTFVAGHLALCAATAALGFWWLRPSIRAEAGKTAVIVLQAAAWTALAGPFGTVIAASVLVPRRAEGAGNATDAGSAAPELTKQELLHRSLLDGRLRLGSAHEVRPMLEVIIEGSQIEKFDALGLISKHYDPALAPALKRALVDKDGSVRVLAATVMASLHGAYTKRIGAAQDAAKAAPASSRHWCDLGQAHFEYASSGLLEAARADSELARATMHLTHAKQLDPQDAVSTDRLEAVRAFVSSGCEDGRGGAAR